MMYKVIKPALVITLPYLILGTLYIAFSDKIVHSLFLSQDMITEVQTYKGWGFIVLTSILLFVLLYRYFKKLENEKTNLEESEERWKSLVSNSPDFIALIDEQGRFLYLNHYAEGFDEKDVIGTRALDMLTDESKIVYKTQMQECITNWTTKRFEFRAYGDNKTIRDYEEFLVPLKNKKQEINLLAVARDITERKEFENAIKESEEKYRTLIENTQEAIYIAQDGKIKYVNKSARDITGRTEEELLEHELTEFVPLEDFYFALEHHSQLISGEVIESQSEYRLVHSEGKSVDLLVNSVLVQWEGRPATLNFASDITDRKQFEKALLLSEEKYRSLSETAKDMIVQYNLNGEITYINPAGMEYIDFNNIKNNESILNFIPEKYHKQLEENAMQRMEGFDGHRLIEIEIIGKKNKLIPVEVNSTPIFMGGKLTGMLSIVRDITERKQAEAELLFAHNRLRQFVDSNIVGVILADATGSIIEANEYYLDMIGYTRKELEDGKVDWKALTPSEWLYKDEIALRELEERGTCSPYEKEYIRRDGTRVSVYLVDAMLPGKDKKIAAFALNITDRKKFETELIASEEKYRSLFDNMDEGLAYCKMIFENGKPIDFKYLTINPRFKYLTGLKDVEGKNVSELIPGIQKDNPELFEIYGRVSMGGKPESFETYVPGLNDWFSISVYSPHTEHFVAVFTIITQRKFAELALQKNRRFLADIVENSGTLIYVKDLEGRYELVNKRWEAVTGLDRYFVLGKTDKILFPGSDGSQFRDNDVEVINENKVIELEEILNTDIGKRYFISIKFPTLDENGKVNGICGMSTEVTERKLAEEELRLSEERYRTITENIKDVVWILDVQSEKYTYISPSVYQQRGYTVEEILEQPLSESLTSQEKYKLKEFIVDRVKEFLNDPSKPTFFTDEVEQPCKDGSTIWTEIVTNYYVNEKTGRIEVRGVSRDVTERRKIQEAIKESEERYRTITENIKDVVWVLDTNTGMFLYISPSVYKLRGYTVEEIISEPVYAALTKESIELLNQITIERINKFLSTGVSDYYIDEIEQPCKDGSTVWTEVVTNFYLNNETGHIEVRGVSRDINERKKIQDALKESEERFRATLDTMLEGCQILDSNLNYVYINDEAEKQNHRPKSELLGNNYPEMWPGIETTYVYRILRDCAQNKVTHQFENEFTYPDGTVGWFDLSIQPIREGVFILSIDITERKKAENAILESREKLRALASGLEKVREEERINLSRELHDHLGQNLTGLKMDTAYLTKLFNSDKKIDKKNLVDKTNGMSDLIDDLIKNVRKISSELRPNVLDYLGLVPAIEWQVEDFKKRTEIDCSYFSNIEKIDMGMQINSSIFRIIQEAFTNIIRHSKATKVDLLIDEQINYISIKISDNGIGINEKELSDIKSLGILGMKERTLNFKGQLRIENAESGGTILTLTIPKELTND